MKPKIIGSQTRVRERAEVSVLNYPIEQSSVTNDPKSIYGADFAKKTTDKGVSPSYPEEHDMEVFIDTLTKFNQIQNLYKNTETDLVT